MVVDVVTFNGEYDILEIRLNILGEYVDQFIIVEAPTTFSGKEKPCYFYTDRFNPRWDKWRDKINWFIIDENYTEEEIRQAEESPNTKGASHWKREFLQKESIKKALTHLQDNDIEFIGDVDEIWNPQNIGFNFASVFIRKLHLKVYCYYLNNLSTENFYGTLVSMYKYTKNECLNHLRSTRHTKTDNGGWHFTSMGGLEEVRRKLSDSYTEESYWNKDVQNNLEERHGRQDFLGRNFTYTIDESGWPQYLKDNREKYIHLCANS